ncbi:MAG: polysaccharide pyruvyl transferase family protein [Bacteroidota bacterium]
MSTSINLVSRRNFVTQLGLGLAGILAGCNGSSQPKRILVRSSWQTVNIGDIAHTPGLLRIIETYLPDVEVYLWASKLDNGVDRILATSFPKLKIIEGEKALQQAFKTCDFLLHGSGASLVAERDVVRWYQETGKPYGFYGITFPPQKSHKTNPEPADVLAKSVGVLSKADFVFFRDSKSLAFAKELGCTCPVMQFGPDAAFACDLRDDDLALSFLSEHGLEAGKYLCCIPRLRYTAFWGIPSMNGTKDEIKHARNEEMKEHDHAPLREAIVKIVQQTDLKVLICPEDQTQMQVGKEMLYDKLPDEVRTRVVWRPDYWLTGEAISTYVRSVGLFGNEMHSPIFCVGHGVPAIVCRWAEQTTKGYMWEDIGLGDWLFDLDDESQVQLVVPKVLEMAKNPEEFKTKALKASETVKDKQEETMVILAEALK